MEGLSIPVFWFFFCLIPLRWKQGKGRMMIIIITTSINTMQVANTCMARMSYSLPNGQRPLFPTIARFRRISVLGGGLDRLDPGRERCHINSMLGYWPCRSFCNNLYSCVHADFPVFSSFVSILFSPSLPALLWRGIVPRGKVRVKITKNQIKSSSGFPSMAASFAIFWTNPPT